MALKKELYILAFFITLFLLMTLLLFGSLLGDKRESYIDEEVSRVYTNIYELQTFSLMAETYGDEMACLAFGEKLSDLDDDIWNLGIKLDQYRIASEEFRKDPFYLEQKRFFNENEVLYMMLLQKLKTTCGYDQVIVAYFYRNSEDCRKCDDQSFVLTDVNKDFDEYISIFSYDMDMNVTSITLLSEYYNLSSLPCVVVEEEVHCGMLSKDELETIICDVGGDIPACAFSAE